MNENSVIIVAKSDISSKTGKPYNYISVSVGDIELTRLFPRATEKSFYASILGDYKKIISQK